MEKDKAYILDDRGYIFIEGKDSEEFLQNILTNDVNKIKTNNLIFSSILSPQGKYLYEFFVIKYLNKYLIECEKDTAKEVFDFLNFYKLRSKVTIAKSKEKYISCAISLEKFNEIKTENKNQKSFFILDENCYFEDPRLKKLGGRIITKEAGLDLILKKMNLISDDKSKFFSYCFKEGVPSVNLSKLKNNLFGVECNLENLNGLDLKKGCFIGQENTSRIMLRNKLRKRLFPIQKISGEILENDIIKYDNREVGKVMIDKPYSFALIKIVDPELSKFVNTELVCGKSKIKILKPEWIA
tara:strand:+ start:96 stop:989 length:894 start_codon:yes stop_codon:yes gene_type:complete